MRCRITFSQEEVEGVGKELRSIGTSLFILPGLARLIETH